MKKERKDDSFLKQAYYKGGDTALKEFISQNLKYPESSKKIKSKVMSIFAWISATKGL